MAQFRALTFDFANNHSMNYDVYIVDFMGLSGWQTEIAGSNINIISDSVHRHAEQYIYGVRQDEALQFNITIGSPNAKSRAEIDRLTAWLVQITPQCLCVGQDDMEFYRYKGFFINPQLISVNGQPFGMQLTFVSTSPFAYTFPRKKILNIEAPLTYIFNNDSGDNNYLYPTLIYTPANITQFFSIINDSDNGREFRFDFNAPFPNGSEVITIDNRLQIVKSNAGLSKERFNQFNMNFLRLIRGRNELRITGNGSLEIHYVFARRIGA